jgi:hypothetical protein
MHTTARTSRAHYRKLDATGLYALIMTHMREHPEDTFCIADVAKDLGLERSTVSARLNEMLRFDMIEIAGEKPSRATGGEGEALQIERSADPVVSQIALECYSWRMTAIVRAALALIVSLWAGFSLAQSSDDERLREHMRKQYGGWDGIVFVCEPEAAASWTQSLCTTAAQDARFLANVARIPFVNCGSCSLFELYSKPPEQGVQHQLDLHVTVYATTKAPSGGAIRVWASRHYWDAVSAAASEENPAGMPRNGDLVLWEKYVAFYSLADPPDTGQISQVVETVLKDFFSTFMEARDTAPGDR